MKLKEQLVQIAVAEWIYFGNQTAKYTDNAGDVVSYQYGHREDEDPYYLRVGKYWREALDYKFDGRTALAWSAAFISFLMKSAGLSKSEFLFNEQHSKYIRKAILAKQANDMTYGFWAYQLDEYQPQVGDLVCYLRDSAIGTISYNSNSNDYPAHADLVVAKNGSLLEVIGGNVGDSVTKKILHLDAAGFLVDDTKKWFVVIKNLNADRVIGTDPVTVIPTESKRYLVTGDGVRLRPFPSKEEPKILDSLFRGDEVDFHNQSEDKFWAQVTFKGQTGWMASQYLKAKEENFTGTHAQHIDDIVQKSSIVNYPWKDRGRAPIGYYQGMGLMFARLYCRLKINEKIATELAKPAGVDPKKDALKYYEGIFEELGMDNESQGVDTLRHLFVLMIGLGMRESSGRHCVGRDTTADNTTSETAEAGLFQTSYNARNLNSLLSIVFSNYRLKPNGFVDTFAKGVTCGANNWNNFGSGDGAEFQKLSKECPGFAVEFSALALRNTSLHWGPIKRREVEIRPECDTLFLKIQNYVDQNGLKEI